MKTSRGAEALRLGAAQRDRIAWNRWGPYVSERQWGTVREDYSADGAAWEYFPHEHARSRAYRWGEDGIAGICDDQQRLCLALVLWNGRDSILKERMFGLSGAQGNHGEDVKELYYYLDATPTHSYLKLLYKYPQREFPYDRLIEENRRRGLSEPEYELLDTGIFDDDRYFDVFVEYAKAAPDDILMQVTVHNRGPEPAGIHVLPQLWFRNTWSWSAIDSPPRLAAGRDGAIEATHPELGDYRFQVDGQPPWLFTGNDTNAARVYGQPAGDGYFKDAFHDYLVHGRHDAVNPAGSGTKAAAHCRLAVGPGEARTVRARLSRIARRSRRVATGFANFDEVVATRRHEADEFHRVLQPRLDEDARNVQRQALAGMIWSKQFFRYDVKRWLRGDAAQPPPPPERRQGRNREWLNIYNADVISMPDKWEFPWYAAWDLAFHCLPLATLDAEFAKRQLALFTREDYMHPNGQLPAYEWNLGDVNPPVHAWATWRVFEIDRAQRGDDGDLAFLEAIFHKLMVNYCWWTNRTDARHRNVFMGGFLGLDNIGAFDRNTRLPDGVQLEQADGTGWMAMFTANMLRIALQLARHNPVYEQIAARFFGHFVAIATAMNHPGDEDWGPGLWDEADGFYYDKLRAADDRAVRLKSRSMVGLIPLCAVEVLEPAMLDQLRDFAHILKSFVDYRPDLDVHVRRWLEPGVGDRRLLAMLRGERLTRVLGRVLDETEFLSDYGVRAVSRQHLEHPFEFAARGQTFSLGYEPGESQSRMFGGNSNWRGPVWFPVNFLIIDALHQYHRYYGDDFKVECPNGSGQFLTLEQVAGELSGRLGRIFLRDEQGRRAVFGRQEKLQTDPHFRDYLLFHEYFHGDSGKGLGASHQTGWTGLIATSLQRSGSLGARTSQAEGAEQDSTPAATAGR